MTVILQGAIHAATKMCGYWSIVNHFKNGGKKDSISVAYQVAECCAQNPREGYKYFLNDRSLRFKSVSDVQKVNHTTVIQTGGGGGGGGGGEFPC